MDKLNILILFEREIERYEIKKEISDNMKLDVSQMIKEGTITENTCANKEFVDNLKSKYI